MRITDILRRVVRNSDRSVQFADEMVAGIRNQSRLQNDRFQEIIEGQDNQSQLLNRKLQELIEGQDNQTQQINKKLQALVESMIDQSRLLNDKFMAVIHCQDILTELHKAEIAEIRELLKNGGSGRCDLSTIQAPPVSDGQIDPARHSMKIERRKTESVSLDTALGRYPLMIDAKTYNTSHPDYNSNLVRNFPGNIFNAGKTCSNIVFANLKRLAKNDEIPDVAWKPILDEALEEAKTVPQSDQVFERRLYIEKYVDELKKNYDAHYAPGWVNLDDALFLYWLVRKLNPRTIVQTGVCNGLSSAFMMLGLVKNGATGRLHGIDLAPVFKSKDPRWTIKGSVYGVVIPEGKSSGWMVPDAYQDRFRGMERRCQRPPTQYGRETRIDRSFLP